jgi:hypothetical protein
MCGQVEEREDLLVKCVSVGICFAFELWAAERDFV